jgi:CDP-4-dehydro-6-deoxyglucose reductase, E1
LRRGLDDLGEFFEFMLPTHARAWTKTGFRWDDSGCRSDPSWFGFMLLVRKGTPFSRLDLARFLEERKIGTRMLFGGNLVRQPAWVRLRRDHPHAFRIAAKLAGADQLMESAMFVGVYPGLSRLMLDYIVESVHDFVRGKTRF